MTEEQAFRQRQLKRSEELRVLTIDMRRKILALLRVHERISSLKGELVAEVEEINKVLNYK